MKRKIVIVLLAFGTIGGFAMGFCHLGHRMHQHHESMERHVAQLCVDAARNPPAPR